MKLKKGDSKNKSKHRSKTNTSEIEKIANSKSKSKSKLKSKSKSKSNPSGNGNNNHSKKKKSKSSHNSSSKKKKRSKTDASDLKHSDNHPQEYELNDYVSLTNKRKGLIRYIGTVHFGNGQWFGIELTDGSTGNHDGKVGKTRYFRTASKSATFVTRDQIKKILKSYVNYLKALE